MKEVNRTESFFSMGCGIGYGYLHRIPINRGMPVTDTPKRASNDVEDSEPLLQVCKAIFLINSCSLLNAIHTEFVFRMLNIMNGIKAFLNSSKDYIIYFSAFFLFVF